MATPESASGGADRGVAQNLVVRHRVLIRIVDAMHEALPDEGCGLLFGTGAAQVFYSVPSVARSPVRFTMDPAGLLERMQWAEDHGLALQAVVHSHTTGDTTPSRDDTAMAAQYPDAAQLIIRITPARTFNISAYRYRAGRLAVCGLVFPDSTRTAAAGEYLSR